MIHIAMKKKDASWHRRFVNTSKTAFRWLIPGLGVKRWFIIILLGVTLIGGGFGVLILDFYRSAPDTWWLPVLSVVSLRFLDRPIRTLIFGGLGLSLITYGIWRLNRSIMTPFLRPGGGRVVDTIRSHRRRDRGPRIVALGGGHGLATLLRGLKAYTYNITAIVTVADDGGSSGRLRRDLGILPPGDIRNCLAALSDDEALLGQLFQYRFPAGVDGLEGHSFGNLFISALADITGSFEEAVVESGQVLAIHGQVLPATLRDVHLVADIVFPHSSNEVRVVGESRIPQSAGKVRHVWLEPNNPPAFPQAIQAILAADLIIVGPGSLYTSLLPNLLVPDLLDAIRASRALKVFVCNIVTQVGETETYTCGDHLRAITQHVGQGLFDVLVVNNRCDESLPDHAGWVLAEDDLDLTISVYRADLVDTYHPTRHEPTKLSRVLLDLLQEKTGFMIE